MPTFDYIKFGDGLTVTDEGGGVIRVDALGAPASVPDGIPNDGWIDDTAETWTFVSATTFTVPGDLTAKYSAGTRLKLTQTSIKYFNVVTSSFASSVTTVTFTGGTDYTFANAAVSANYHSYENNPQGWPGWFAYTPTWAGSVSNPAIGNGVLAARFSVMGRQVLLKIGLTMGTTTTFGSGLWTFTYPIAESNSAGQVNGSGICFDVSTGAAINIGFRVGAGTTTNNVTGQQFVSSSIPFTWANLDQFQVSIAYMIAA